MKGTLKVLILSVIGVSLCLVPFYAFSKESKSRAKITQDLQIAGFLVKQIIEKSIPLTDKNYFIVKAVRKTDGRKVKIKVFNQERRNNYFISTKSGRLRPLVITANRVKTRHVPKLRRTHLNEEEVYSDGESKEKIQERRTRKVSSETDLSDSSHGGSGTVNLINLSEVSEAKNRFDNGCGSSSFTSVGGLGFALADTARVLNAASVRPVGGHVMVLGGRRVRDRSRKYKKSKSDSAAEAAFKRAGETNGSSFTNPLGTRESLEKMKEYSDQLLRNFLRDMR